MTAISLTQIKQTQISLDMKTPYHSETLSHELFDTFTSQNERVVGFKNSNLNPDFLNFFVLLSDFDTLHPNRHYFSKAELANKSYAELLQYYLFLTVQNVKLSELKSIMGLDENCSAQALQRGATQFFIHNQSYYDVGCDLFCDSDHTPTKENLKNALLGLSYKKVLDNFQLYSSIDELERHDTAHALDGKITFEVATGHSQGDYSHYAVVGTQPPLTADDFSNLMFSTPIDAKFEITQKTITTTDSDFADDSENITKKTFTYCYDSIVWEFGKFNDFYDFNFELFKKGVLSLLADESNNDQELLAMVEKQLNEHYNVDYCNIEWA